MLYVACKEAMNQKENGEEFRVISYAYIRMHPDGLGLRAQLMSGTKLNQPQDYMLCPLCRQSRSPNT